MRRSKSAFARSGPKWARMGAAMRKKSRMEDFMLRMIHNATREAEIERALRKKAS